MYLPPVAATPALLHNRHGPPVPDYAVVPELNGRNPESPARRRGDARSELSPYRYPTSSLTTVVVTSRGRGASLSLTAFALLCMVWSTVQNSGTRGAEWFLRFAQPTFPAP